MTERSSYQDAVQALKTHMGGRWEGFAADGRDEMVRILKRELGYDGDQAEDAIDAMIASGALRYHEAPRRAVDREVERDVDRASDAERVVDDAVPFVPVPVGTGGSTTQGTAPGPVVPAAGAGGYWQIGDEGGAAGEAGGQMGARKGQVDPT